MRDALHSGGAVSVGEEHDVTPAPGTQTMIGSPRWFRKGSINLHEALHPTLLLEWSLTARLTVEDPEDPTPPARRVVGQYESTDGARITCWALYCQVPPSAPIHLTVHPYYQDPLNRHHSPSLVFLRRCCRRGSSHSHSHGMTCGGCRLPSHLSRASASSRLSTGSTSWTTAMR